VPSYITTVQLSTPYTVSERHNAQRHRQTDGQTDIIMTDNDRLITRATV